MEDLFRQRYVECELECLVTTQKPSQDCQHYHANIHELLGKHNKVFEALPAGRPPYRGFKHVIDLEEGAMIVITTPYRHPKKLKDEIEKAIKELLDM
jgi:hypothetical protein